MKSIIAVVFSLFLSIGAYAGLLLSTPTPSTSAPGITPLTYSPEIYFTAANSGSITKSGGAVSQWNNLGSLPSSNCIASGGAQPTYNSSNSVLNNKPAITFNGSSNQFTFGSSAVIQGGQSFTLFMVFATNTGFASANFYNPIQLVTDQTEGMLFETSGSQVQYDDFFNGAQTHWASLRWPMGTHWGTPQYPNSWLVQFNYNGSGPTTFGNFSVIVNKSSVSTSTTGGISNPVQNSLNYLGGSHGSGYDGYTPMDVSEVVIYVPALSSLNATILQNQYFATKYGF